MDTLLDRPATGNEPRPLAILAALAATALGALVWSAVVYFTGYEVGYVAWAIGGLVGIATVRFGGRGVVYAGVAAVLAVLGIAAGKLTGTHLAVEQELQMTWEATFTPEVHREVLKDASDFAALGSDPGDEELRRFLVDHFYSQAVEPEGVTPEELEWFTTNEASFLADFAEERPSFETWRDQCVANSRQVFEEEFSVVQANLEDLNGIDVLFVVLGVTTAFGIVRKADKPVAGAAGASDDPAEDPPRNDEHRHAA